MGCYKHYGVLQLNGLLLCGSYCFQDPDSLLDETQPLFRMALTAPYSVETQRAGLHFLLALCDKMELSRAVLVRILDALVQAMTNTYDVDYEKTSNLLLLNKVRTQILTIDQPTESIAIHEPTYPCVLPTCNQGPILS